MARLRTEGVVMECHPSMVVSGRYYVTVETKDWGTIKYSSSKERKAGERVILTDQRCRCMTDPIMWTEERRKGNGR